MSKVDTDGSGFIDYTEFVSASLDEAKVMSKKNLQITFKMFDKDGSGSISADELANMLGDEDLKNDEVWRQIINEVD
jgi:calcium-dependent protein kinase